MRTTLLAAAATVLALAGRRRHALGPPDSHSPNADAINSAFWVLLVVVVAVVVVINAALIVALVRFRERRGREPSRFGRSRRPPPRWSARCRCWRRDLRLRRRRDQRRAQDRAVGAERARRRPDRPGGREGPPASARSRAPSRRPARSRSPVPSRPRRARCRSTRSPSSGCGGSSTRVPAGPAHLSYGELGVVPVDTTVILDITSTDVLHTWWVPALGGQVQAAPGDVTRTWFKADEEGRYPGRSTVFSGTGYPAMRAWVRVVSVPDYQHIERLQTDLAEAQVRPADAGGADHPGVRDPGGGRVTAPTLGRLAAGGGHPGRPGRPQAVDRARPAPTTRRSGCSTSPPRCRSCRRGSRVRARASAADRARAR